MDAEHRPRYALVAAVRDEPPERREITEALVRILDEAIHLYLQQEARSADVMSRVAEMSVHMTVWVDAIQALYDRWDEDQAQFCH